MSKASSADENSNAIELEIQALLLQCEQPDLAADALLKKYETKKLSLTEFETLAVFFLKSGFPATLTEFILKKLDSPQSIPWAHFVEALFQSSSAVEPEIKQAMIEGSESQRQFSHLARSHQLDHFEEELIRQRQLRRQSFVEKQQHRQQELQQQADLLKSQQLHADEEKVLQKMKALLSDDTQVKNALRDLHERRAHDLIAKQPPKNQRTPPIYYHEPPTPEVQAMLKQIELGMSKVLKSEKDPSLAAELAGDFAVAHLIWENPTAAVHLLDQSLKDLQNSTSLNWLRAELLLRGRSFVSLLDHLTWLESTYAEDPETIFSAQYLRAQALWGLNQKFTAIEILEGLLHTRPDYRAAAALLNEWKENLA